MAVVIGTGDVAFRSLNALSSIYQSVLLDRGDDTVDDVARQVVVCDINPQMLAVGRDRADKIFKGTERNLVLNIDLKCMCVCSIHI